MSDKKRMLGIMTVTIVCFLIMAFIDGVIKPDYFVKSAWKILFFLATTFYMVIIFLFVYIKVFERAKLSP